MVERFAFGDRGLLLMDQPYLVEMAFSHSTPGDGLSILQVEVWWIGSSPR